VGQSDKHGRNTAQQSQAFAPVDGALIERLNRLISNRGQSNSTDSNGQSSEAATRAVPTLQDMLQRRG
jgi:hypothetical protein